ncbi:flagellar brake protein [Pseudoxanthomonas dokdonensis]|uniref:Flagellar brake protein YcgR n=1 Tax=Pseudoxanthomonas dokdonensis TaxID=344882 RepID=A0A0R0CNQ7_9GAMM|nr:flagellar brake protein [Pseudoxanthomonas dokdonensis]KRG71030.1 hypothetical protein ABB29_04195 [Pseudoxanthomonas dokdonensis]
MSESAVSANPPPVRYEEDEKYLLRGQRKVGPVLNALIERQALISAWISPRNLSFPTALLEYSADTGSVVIDASVNEALNSAVQQCSHLTCVSQLDKVHVQFRLQGLRLQTLAGQPAFVAAAPSQLLQLQRREYYRLPVPLTQPLTCTVDFSDRHGVISRRDLRVLDISAGGIAVVAPDDQPGFRPLNAFESCSLQLPDSEPLPIQLQVRNLFRQKLANGQESWRAGCAFLRLPHGADRLIQRYIFRMERLRTARRQGLV